MPINDDTAATDFDDQRPRLLRIAYRMLGSVTDAEDVVGDVAVQWLQSRDADKAERADNPAGWLTTVTVRRSLDLLRRRKRERRTYVGTWLPEPRVTAITDLPGADGEQDAELSIGFLRLAEALTPVQRAVIILRSLGYSHAEIAGLLEISEDASRQHDHRARTRLAASAVEADAADDHDRAVDHAAPRPGDRNGEAAVARRLLSRFLAAARRGDLDRLLAVLHDDVVAYSDGGGQVKAARRPVEGPLKVARLILGITRRNPDVRPQPVLINGRIGLSMVLAGGQNLLTLDVRDGRIHRFYVIANPEKITAGAVSGRTAY
jgi:RNA polymerase sigma-70 factor (ECF subfamily)